MLDLSLVLYASPTLSGIKSASLFSYLFPDRQEMLAALLSQNRMLSPKGLHLLPLCSHRRRVPLYVYRPAMLAHDLSHPKARALLGQLGYPSSCTACIAHLIRKLSTQDAFPHEIGLFLGYPPGDVLGFMHDPGACLYTGCWKVYENVALAQALFAQYKRCTQHNREQLSRGIPLDNLIHPS